MWQAGQGPAILHVTLPTMAPKISKSRVDFIEEYILYKDIEWELSSIRGDRLRTPMTAVVKRRGLRTHIVALVASALLPALAMGAIAVGAAVDSYHRAFEDRLQSTAAALASAIGSEIETYTAALSALGTARSLDDGDAPDLASFHERARRVADDLGSRIFLIEPDGTMPLHTSFPFGTDLQAKRPVRQSSDVARRVFETGRPAVGNAIVGQMTGRLLTPVYIPVVRSGQVTHALGSVIEAGRLSRLLAAQQFRDGIYAGLVDAGGAIIARSVDEDRYVGQRVRSWMTGGMEGRSKGVLTGVNLVGDRITTAFHRVSQSPGWAVAVAAPDAVFYASLRAPLATLALGGFGSLALSLMVAMRLGRRILEPVDWLTCKAERVVASGGEVEVVPEGPPVRVHEFERLRAAVVQAHLTLQKRAAAVAAGEARLRAVVDTAVDAIIVTDSSSVIRSLNPAAKAIFGYTQTEVIGREMTVLVHEEDKDAPDSCSVAVASRDGRHEASGRQKSGSTVPLEVSVAGWFDEAGDRFFTWIMRDVSVRKAEEARRVLLAREVDHRAKNVLAVVQSVLRLSPRHDPQAFVVAVEARIAALTRVHSLLAEEGWHGADLRAVAERELAAYILPSVSTRKHKTGVSLIGPPTALAAAAVQPMAMILHELATNAAKHGAMSVPDGKVEVQWYVDDAAESDRWLRLRWAESGGPSVEGPPARSGFGSRVMQATVRSQLGGTVEWRWEQAGLVVKVAIPLARVAAVANRPSVVATKAA